MTTSNDPGEHTSDLVCSQLLQGIKEEIKAINSRLDRTAAKFY